MTSTQIKILAVLGALVGVLAVFTAVVFALDPGGDGGEPVARATATPSGTVPPTAVTATRGTGSATPTRTATGTATPPRSGVVVRAPTAANVRGGPSTDFDIVTTLEPGEEMTVTGRNADGTWLQVTHSTGPAWIAADVVEVVNGSLTSLPAVATPSPAPPRTPEPTRLPATPTPVTQPAATEAPITEAPATRPPATQPPATRPPATAQPAPVETAAPAPARTAPPAPAVTTPIPTVPAPAAPAATPRPASP